MMADLAKRYAAPVPRYTSYPTALSFNPRIGAADVRSWLSGLEEGAQLSLYLHVPFCASLCWYCGCTTTVVNRYAPVERYVEALTREIAEVSSLVRARHRVTHMHWGGGSPNTLRPEHIGSLAALLRDRFQFDASAEFAVEVDPRGLDRERVEAFAAAGANRASIGVQDFDPAVQAAINRTQSFETTEAAVEMLRAAGVASINIDLVYGLPHQTRASLDATLEKVLSLDPDRIAVFGYAHLPERIRHQRLIDASTLAGPVDRLCQASRLGRRLEAQGYVRVGLDHFAKPGDPLATGRVRRNFQGYTTDCADALIGLGSSAISGFPQGFTQNEARVADYERRVEADGLATARGVALTPDDRVRAYVIERLMCRLDFSASEVAERFGAAAAPLVEEAQTLVEADTDGLIERTDDGFRVTERGRPFLRSICSCFDAYLGSHGARHSVGV